MPIVDIEIVGGVAEGRDATSRLAFALGQALGAPAGSVWVRLRHIDPSTYAENGPAPCPLPVFVRVLARGDGGANRATTARLIADAVAADCGRPRERVHVIFEPDAQGRVYFGGAPDSR